MWNTKFIRSSRPVKIHWQMKLSFSEIGVALVLKIADRLNSKQIALKYKFTFLHTSTVSYHGLGMEYSSNAEFLHLFQEKFLSMGCLTLID